MQSLGFKELKTLDQLNSLRGSASRAAKPLPICTSSYSGSVTSGSFASLQIAAEKLVKEQASVRADLDLANSKLKKSAEHICNLEEKLQTSLNENTELRVKQKEHEKLWQGLESKFSSTKDLCDQLTETLQVLADQVHGAEKDKQLIEGKLSRTLAALDNLNDQMGHLSLKLDSAEETIRDRDKELKELRIKKEEREAFHQDQQCKSMKIIEEKDALIKSLEADIAANKSNSKELKSKLDGALVDLRQNEEALAQMKVSLEKLQRANTVLQATNDELADKLAGSLHEIQNLKDTISAYASELIELDKQSLSMFHRVNELSSGYNTLFKLHGKERDLTAKGAQKHYDQLNQDYIRMISEREELHSINQALKDKVYELQRVQESIMVQHAEECHLTEEQTRNLESQVEDLLSRKKENEKLITELEEKACNLSESLKLSEDKMKVFLLKLSKLESENKENTEKLHADVQKKADELKELQVEFGERNEQVELLEKEVSKLVGDLKDKEQLLMHYKEREKHLEDQRAEIQALLVTAECKLGEAKKQYDSMLESKQMELSRHLKEISQRNDQAINDIRKKFELEKQEILNLEKEKADKAVAEMERNCEQRLAQCQEESRTQLAHIQEEHIATIRCMQEKYERKESSLKSGHFDELKCIELQSENELREKIKAMRNEYEVQIKALRLEHEDECRQLQELLDVQKSTEERQRALLQLQWKVMGVPQEEQEVNSKKECSVSSMRMRGPNMGMRSIHTSARAQDLPDLAAEKSPMSTLLRKVEKENSGCVMDLSKHSQKVTRREYEVETNNGGTITKRRKTKSTVMYGDPRRNKRTPRARASPPRHSAKGAVVGGNTQPSNIGDLFTEGSLNPYADDPYAFD